MKSVYDVPGDNKYNEHVFRALLEHSDDCIVIFSSLGIPTYVSPSVKKVLGYTEREVMEMDIFTLAHPDDYNPGPEIMERILMHPGIPMKSHTGRMRHKNGDWRWIECTVTNLLDDPSVGGIVDNFRDVTERKLAEEQILHANRLYAFISQVNQTIVRVTNEEDLFKEVCRIAIAYGHFKVAWIGLFNLANKTINLVQQGGMMAADLSLFKDAPYAEGGPQERVLSTGSYVVFNNVQKDVPLTGGRHLPINGGTIPLLPYL